MGWRQFRVLLIGLSPWSAFAAVARTTDRMLDPDEGEAKVLQLWAATARHEGA